MLDNLKRASRHPLRRVCRLARDVRFESAVDVFYLLHVVCDHRVPVRELRPAPPRPRWELLDLADHRTSARHGLLRFVDRRKDVPLRSDEKSAWFR